MASENKVVVEWTPSPRGMLGPLTLEQAWLRAYNAYWDAIEGTCYHDNDPAEWNQMIQEIATLGEEWRFLDRLLFEKDGGGHGTDRDAYADHWLAVAQYRRDQDLARNK